MLKNKIVVSIFVTSLLLLSFLVPKRAVATSVIGSTKITLYAVADAYVNSSNPNTNYGSESRLYVTSDTEVEYTYVMFNLSSVPSNATILSAEIMLYLQNTGGDIYWYPADTIGVHYCSESSWEESGITWGNKPSFNPMPTDTWSFGIIYRIREYKSWNVTKDVKTALSSGRLTEVVKFVAKTGSGYANFNSREGTNKPKLQIEYATNQVCNVRLESIQDSGETANLGFITFATETFSLPLNVNVVAGSYQINYIGGYTFVRWETSGGINVSDPKAQSTMVTVSGNGTLRVVGNAKRIEYAYDFGNRLWESEESGCIDAVRFTPLCSGQLITARFYIAGLSWNLSENTFKVHVMDADRNDLMAPFGQTPTSEDRWFDVDLSNYGLNVTASVDFYIGIEWMFDYWPAIDKTYSHPLTQGRSWYWNGTTWAMEGDYDFMIRAVVGTLIDHRVTDGFDFRVFTESNSTISNFEFIQAEKKILFNVAGPSGTKGFCNVTIPKQLLGGPFDVLFDGENVANVILSANITHTSFYFIYDHSGHWVEIIGTTVIPEFPAFLALLILMATTLIAVIFRKKIKH
jgi:hypothetical protein